jgi:hypothetical protein
MVEPVSLTLGAIAAAVVAKAADKSAEGVVEGGAGAARRLLGWLRERFTADGDSDGAKALDRVEDAPDSPSRLQELASALDRRAVGDAGFRSALVALVDEARAGGVDVGSIVQSAWGTGILQNAGNADSTITVSYGQALPPGR